MKLKGFCKAAKMKEQVAGEEAWLSCQDDCVTKEKITQLRKTLFDTRPQQVILRAGTLSASIDTESLSCLSRERYLDNFVIDVCLQKYQVDANSSSRPKHSLCLPSHAFTWIKQEMNFFIDKIKPLFSNVDIAKLSLVLLPVHLNQCHWGLLAVDFDTQAMYFDDGLQWDAPGHLLEDIKHILAALLSMLSQHDAVLKELLCEEGFRRFGMPKQMSNGTGSGSCGVGVILAARDIIYNGTARTQSQWNFHQMRGLRKLLAIQILEWSGIC